MVFFPYPIDLPHPDWPTPHWPTPKVVALPLFSKIDLPQKSLPYPLFQKLIYPKSRCPTPFSKNWSTPKVVALPLFPKIDLPQKWLTYPKMWFFEKSSFLARVDDIQDKRLFYLLNDFCRYRLKVKFQTRNLISSSVLEVTRLITL